MSIAITTEAIMQNTEVIAEAIDKLGGRAVIERCPDAGVYYDRALRGEGPQPGDEECAYHLTAPY